MAGRSEVWVCGRSPAGIASSNPAGRMDISCRGCCVLWGRGLCNGPITRPEESYRVWCVWVWFGNLYNELSLAHKDCRAWKNSGEENIKNMFQEILYLWFRASLVYINNCPTRCNTKQSIYNSAIPLRVPGVNHATCIQRGQAWPRWMQVAAQKIWQVPEAVVTVLCTHDGCGWHPKHVEWTCRVINRLLCVASRWIVINICFMKGLRTER